MELDMSAWNPAPTAAKIFTLSAAMLALRRAVVGAVTVALFLAHCAVVTGLTDKHKAEEK